jgi:two-component system, cell cycle response regulator
MTLRARLTAAFLAVVLGPVLLGAFFVGATVATVSRERAVERLDQAAASVRTSIGALCGQLRAAAEAIAVAGDAAARTVVDRGLASTVQVGQPPPQWADCAGRAGTGAIAVQVGTVFAAQAVDQDLVRRLAAAARVDVTLPGGLSTELSGSRGAVLAAAGDLHGDSVGSAGGDRYVRRVDQPLPVVLSTTRSDPRGLYLGLIAGVVLAGLAAVAAAWWLARSTTEPLDGLAVAVDRVARGDLTTRVPVRAHDEVGVLAAAFNRMTREMQGYVQALTASRDQLRGQMAILGDTLSSTHDLDRILAVTLQTALAATGARAGVVLLLDKSTGLLRGSGLSIPLGSGLLGSVAATGVPRRGRVERDGPALCPEEPPCRTYIAVPCCGGVLALYDRHGNDEFDDADLVTLRTFAGQAAVAVDNVRAHEETQRLSLTDPLTGLWNYRYLKESIRREVERASRFGRMLSVLALDLDRFKQVNDTYGHAAGDAVLAEFARRIQTQTREVDLAFRQGGEEFVILLPETDARGAATLAERLGAVIRASPVPVGEARIAVTVSIGIAVYPDHALTGQEALDAADDALYAAKAAGRDTYRVCLRHAQNCSR